MNKWILMAAAYLIFGPEWYILKDFSKRTIVFIRVWERVLTISLKYGWWHLCPFILPTSLPSQPSHLLAFYPTNLLSSQPTDLLTFEPTDLPPYRSTSRSYLRLTILWIAIYCAHAAAILSTATLEQELQRQVWGVPILSTDCLICAAIAITTRSDPKIWY